MKELYSDLKKYYDSREELCQFTIVKPATSVEFVTMLGALKPFGYRGDGQLYYLNPAPGSQPSTGLVPIDGQEEVNELVLAHEKEGTKICHLHLVKGCNDDLYGVSIGSSPQKKLLHTNIYV